MVCWRLVHQKAPNGRISYRNLQSPWACIRENSVVRQPPYYPMGNPSHRIHPSCTRQRFGETVPVQSMRRWWSPPDVWGWIVSIPGLGFPMSWHTHHRLPFSVISSSEEFEAPMSQTPCRKSLAREGAAAGPSCCSMVPKRHQMGFLKIYSLAFSQQEVQYISFSSSAKHVQFVLYVKVKWCTWATVQLQEVLKMQEKQWTRFVDVTSGRHLSRLY